MSAPIIYRLAIERFRCIRSFSWHPAKGVNLILGGGDVGKTTILDAIGLLFSPTNPTTLADTDYHARNIDAGFVIEAIVSLPLESGINQGHLARLSYGETHRVQRQKRPCRRVEFHKPAQTSGTG